MRGTLLLLLFAAVAESFPFVARVPGVDSSLLHKGRPQPEKRQGSCPFNANHKPAAPFNSKYPYTGAKNGLPGTQVGGVKVPADGDTAHAFEAPGSNDIRGPCPGLNTAANHHFLSHDGIVTFNELIDAQQNLYNVGYDLAVLLAVLGVGLDGDIVTGKLSIGCDATSRTSNPLHLGSEGGLSTHNKFEGDTSLTRNDYFLANGDDYSFNGTLFAEMKKYADTVSGGLFDLNALAAYRAQRYDESKATNPNFYYGPKSLLLYGAATFLYELFPSYGPEGPADLATIKSFFGAVQNGDTWTAGGEHIPDNWFNRRAPYTIADVASEIGKMYLLHPRLFGGNVGVNNFDALGTFESIKDGKLPDQNTAAAVTCLLYQLATENVPSSLKDILELPLDVVIWATGKLNPIFKNAGCPLRIT